MRKKKSYLLHVLMLLILGTSCSRYPLKSSSTTTYSPEAVGKRWHGSVHIGIERRGDYVSSEECLDSSISVEGRGLGVGGETGIGLDLELSIFERIDIYQMLPLYSRSINLMGVKYQFIGDTRINAKQGNHSLSIFLGEGKRTKDDREDFDSEDTSSAEGSANTARYKSEVHLAYGYRFTSKWLIYTNFNYGYERFKGELVSDNEDIDGQPVFGKTNIKGLSLGSIYYKGNTSFLIEMNAKEYNWTNSERAIFTGGAFKIGWHW